MTLKKFLAKGFRFFLGGVGLFCGFGGMIWFSYQSFQEEYSFTAPSAHSEIKITVDREGIPHIQADNDLDVYRGLGYMHARNRLWEMETNRLKLKGELASVVGEFALASDQLYAPLHLEDYAHKTWQTLDQETKDILNAYTEGVNTLIHQENKLFHFHLPLESFLYWHRPNLWTVTDSLLLALGLQLSQTAGAERTLSRFYFSSFMDSQDFPLMLPIVSSADTLSMPRLTQKEQSDIQNFYKDFRNPPPLPLSEDTSQPLISLKQGSGQETSFVGIPPLPFQENTLKGTSWVLANTRTTTKGSLMGVQIMTSLKENSPWYLAHLHFKQEISQQSISNDKEQPSPKTKATDIIGSSIAGLPFIFQGRNEFLAWSITPTSLPTQSVHIEHTIESPSLKKEDMNKPSSPTATTTNTEIPIRWKEKAFSSYKPLEGGLLLPPSVSDAYNLKHDYGLSVRWLPLQSQDNFVQTLLKSMRSPSLEKFSEVFQGYQGIAQRILLADHDGKMNHRLFGHIFRYPAQTAIVSQQTPLAGELPLPSWIPSYAPIIDSIQDQGIDKPFSGGLIAETGGIDFLKNPNYTMPQEEILSSRHQALIDFLNERALHSLDSFSALLIDKTDPLAKNLLPLLVALTREEDGVKSIESEKAMTRLLGWDGVFRPEGQEPLLFSLWIKFLGEEILKDDLSETAYSLLPNLEQTLYFILTFRPTWCDHKDTLPIETCGQTTSTALEKATDALTHNYEHMIEGGYWGEAHQAILRSQTLGHIPLVRRLFRLTSPIGGGNNSLDYASYDFQKKTGFSVHESITYRAVYDLANPNRSVYMHMTGQVENPLLSGYGSFLNRWISGENILMSTDPLDYELGKNSIIYLKPEKEPH
jgi:penicillin G amidase